MSLADDQLDNLDKTEAAPEPEARDGEGVVLNGRYEIIPTEPLPEYNSPLAQAFAARDRRDPVRQLCALVCTSKLPVRQHLLEQRRKRSTHLVLQPAFWAPVEWPPLNRVCMIIVLDRATGRPLVDDMNAPFKPFTVDRVLHEVLRPIVAGLKEFDELRVPHRAIRPNNLYADSTGLGSIVLGDCYSAPAGYLQPVLFEPIERSLAPPAGRGEGTSADDMYALGVTLVVLLFGGDPLAGKTDQEIIGEKIARGTHGALVGKTSVPIQIAPALRGLLSDDPTVRWSVHDLERWLEGSPMNPTPKLMQNTADRPFPFLGAEHTNARSLSLAFHLNWDAAIGIVKSGELETWLNRSLHDSKLSEAYESIGHSGDAGKNRLVSDDLLMSRALIVLDPSAPIRFRDFVAMPDGFAASTANLEIGSTQAAHYAAVIEGKLPTFWLTMQKEMRTWMTDSCEQLHKLQKFISQRNAGFHIERCMYEVNPTMPCRSPLVEDRYIVDRQQLLELLEERAEDGSDPVDRHVAAFLGARLRGKADRIFNELAGARGDPAAAIACMRLLGLVQSMNGSPLPRLCQFYFGRLKGGLARFKNRTLREKLEQEISVAVKRGFLAEMLVIFENPHHMKLDISGFKMARQEYARASAEIESLTRAVGNRGRLAQLLGHRMAAYASGAIAALAGAMMLLIKLS